MDPGLFNKEIFLYFMEFEEIPDDNNTVTDEEDDDEYAQDQIKTLELANSCKFLKNKIF